MTARGKVNAKALVAKLDTKKSKKSSQGTWDG